MDKPPDWIDEPDWVEMARTIPHNDFVEACLKSLAINGMVVLHPAFATAIKLYRPELWAVLEGVA